MHNYYPDIVWSINAVLSGVLVLTSVIIIIAVIYRDYVWKTRRRKLLDIKKRVWEAVLSGKKPTEKICYPFAEAITPQQFIDIETNRNIDLAFFNESERQFFKGCFIKEDNISRLENLAMNSKDKWRKVEAILSLGYTHTESAVDILKKLLYDKDTDISYFSIISLGEIKTVRSAKALLDFLKKSPDSGYKIISVLQDFPKEIADEVIRLTEYHDPLVKLMALKLLSKFITAGHIAVLEKLTHDKSDDIRAAACDCLGNIGGEKTKSALTRCLKDDSWLVKSRAVIALGQAIGDAAIPDVISLIDDASWTVFDSVRNVMTSHIEASLPYIKKFLEGTNELAKKNSILALQNSGYIHKLLNKAASGGADDLAMAILKGIVKSGLHVSLDAALAALTQDARVKALELITKIEEA